jgi:hypothetical protein
MHKSHINCSHFVEQIISLVLVSEIKMPPHTYISPPSRVDVPVVEGPGVTKAGEKVVPEQRWDGWVSVSRPERFDHRGDVPLELFDGILRVVSFLVVVVCKPVGSG